MHLIEQMPFWPCHCAFIYTNQMNPNWQVVAYLPLSHTRHNVGVPDGFSDVLSIANVIYLCSHDLDVGGRRSPAVACWASDHWVASSNPLRGSFVINFASLSPASA